MFTKALLVVAIAATINLSSALKCNLCMGKPGGSCDNGEASAMAVQECSWYSSDQFLGFKTPEAKDDEYDISCASVEFSDRPEVSALALRSCGYVPKGVDLCKYVEQSGPVTRCSVCQTDNCN